MAITIVFSNPQGPLYGTPDTYTWTWQYNPNLIGQDKFPPGQEAIPDQYFKFDPEPYPYRTWEWKYNRNLIGKDKFPQRLTDQPNPQLVIYWDNFYSENLLQTTLKPVVVVALPKNQYDWPNPQPVIWYQSWEKDLGPAGRLRPFRQTDWPVPPEFREYRDWQGKYLLELIGRDKRNPGSVLYDLTTPDIRDYRSWEYSYLKTLIGQDKLPNRQQDWPTPTPVTWYQTWDQRFQKTPVVIQNPFRQTDWPLPYPVSWYQDWNQNIQENQTSLQITPYDYQVFIFPYWDNFIGVNLLQTTLKPVVVVHNPFYQTDWPNYLPVNWYQDWSWKYSPELIGKDKLPTRQQDWPNPYPVQWYQTWDQRFQKVPPPTAAPFKQIDWPLPYPVSWYQDWSQNIQENQTSLQITPYDYQVFIFPYWDNFVGVNLLQGTLRPVVGNPFKQLDWPLYMPVTWYQSQETGRVAYYPTYVTVQNISDLPPQPQVYWDKFVGFNNPNYYPPTPSVFVLMPQICL
jgi:hypothetical protein